MKKYLLYYILIAVSLVVWCWSAEGQASGKRQVWVIEFDGPVNPGMATYVVRGLKEAEAKRAEAVIIRLDTPGGLLSSMRRVVKAILNASVPVIVYVAPRGAGAASAGVIITMSAHIAAMAPGTNIGAAHPVGSGGSDLKKNMSEKVVNDMVSYARSIAEERGRNRTWVEKAIRKSVSITARDALKRHVIDLVASDIPMLLKKVDGKKIRLAAGTVTLHTGDVTIVHYRPGLRDRILKTISDPNISYILMIIGLTGIYFELAHPGAVLPGVIGGISLILAFYSFQTLPVNYAGILLIFLGLIFFVAEAMITSYGMLAIGGTISFVLGSLMLFDDIRVSMEVLVPTVILVGAFFLVVAGLAVKAHMARPMGGMDGLVGERAEVVEWNERKGMVFVHGEYWKAVSEEELEPGQEVEVLGSKGLTLTVKKRG